MPISLGNISAHEFALKNREKVNNCVFTYLCGVDNVNLQFKNFVVYQGIFKNDILKNVNLVFPVSAYTERISTYLNLEGRFRFTKIVVSSNYYSD